LFQSDAFIKLQLKLADINTFTCLYSHDPIDYSIQSNIMNIVLINIDVIKYYNELLNFKAQDKKEFYENVTNFLKFKNQNMFTNY
jgi:hypothetical protein